MIESLSVRASTSGDLDAIEALYLDAFPEEDLLPLVRDLMTLHHGVLSTVGSVDSTVIAHVIFTNGSVDQSGSIAALLGPLAVASRWQLKGVGSHLIGDGLQRVQHKGIGHVLVLGDPRYYRRFGFSPEVHVAPPYPLAAEWRGAWQGLKVGDGDKLSGGTLQLPQPWQRKDLWMP